MKRMLPVAADMVASLVVMLFVCLVIKFASLGGVKSELQDILAIFLMQVKMEKGIDLGKQKIPEKKQRSQICLYIFNHRYSPWDQPR